MVADVIGGAMMMAGGGMLTTSSITLAQAQIRKRANLRVIGDALAQGLATTAQEPVPEEMADLLGKLP